MAFLSTHDGGELFFVFPDLVGAVVSLAAALLLI